MTTRSYLAAAALLAATACAGASEERPPEAVVVADNLPSETEPRLSPEPRPPRMSPLGLAPTLGALPPLPSGSSPALVDAHRSTVEVRETTPLPDSPDARSMEEVRVWSTEGFTRWLSARRDAVAGVQSQIGELTASVPRHEVAVAAGLHGRVSDELQEDLLGATPIPDEILRDDQLLETYASAIWNMARSLLERAAESFRSCSEHLDQPPPGWESWRVFCHDRTLVIEQALANPPDMQTVRHRVEASR